MFLQVSSLTTGADSLTSGASDDSYDASFNSAGNQTLNSLDSIGAGEGADTLNAFISASVTPKSIIGVETINVGSTAAATFGLSNATGVENVNIVGSTGAFTLSGISKAISVAIADSAVAHTVSYNDVTGSSDSATVNLASLTGGNALTVAGVEALTINSSGASNVALTATSAGLLTFTGTGNFTSSSLAGNGMLFVRSIDGSAASGNLSLTTGGQTGLGSTDLTVTGGSGNDSLDVSAHTTSDINVDGGAGNDTITIALGADDTVAGGDGTDTLVTTTAAGTGATVSGFESFVADAALTQDFDFLSGNEFATVGIDVAGAASVTFRDAPASVTTLNLNRSALAANTGTVALDRSTDTASDSVRVNARGSDQTGLTLTHENSITVDSSTAATVITTLTAPQATSLTITGDEDLTIGSLASNVALATVDASASTGAVSVGATANASLADMTFTAGSGGLTADGGTGADTMTGGAGVDSFDGNDGNDTLSGGAGNDDLDGGAGNDTLNGGDGNDAITTGAGVDTVDGGAGNDTITVGANYATTDVIDGGDGTDTLQLTTAAGTTTPTAASLTSVEVIEMSAAAGGTNILNLANVSDVASVSIEETANAVATTITSLASGGSVTIEEDAAVVQTIDTVADASVTVNVGVTKGGGSIAVTDAQSVTIRGTAATGDAVAVALDAIDTTSLALTQTLTNDLDTGAITGTDQITSLTITTVADGGEIDVDTFDDASNLAELTVTGVGGDITTATIGAGGGNDVAENLTAFTVSATAGSNITMGDLSADTSNDDPTDTDLTLTASAAGTDALGNASAVSLGDIDNQFGAITANISGDQDVDLDVLTGVGVTINRSGAGGTQIEDIAASGALTINLTGSGAMDIGSADGIAATGTLTVSGATHTGVIELDTDTTGNLSITTGSANDVIVADGTTAAGRTHTISTGAGNDDVTGGAGTETINLGDGNDVVDPAGGDDVLNGGAGNDTFTMGSNLDADDTIDGGDGTDTVTATLAANYTSNLANIERVTLDLGNAITANLAASSTINLITITGTAAGDDSTVSGIASGATVRVNDADIIADIDTVADATVTILNTGAANNRELTVTDAANVILSTSGINGAFNNVVLDAVDTDSLTVNGSSTAAETYATGNITGTNALSSISASTSVTGATVTVGTLADADSLTSLTLNASLADADIGQVGTNATANNAELLETVTVSASGVGVTATMGAIFADSTVDSTTDLAMTVTATSSSGSTVTMGAIDNTFGSITGTYATSGTTTQGALTAASMTLTKTGGGDATFANFNSTGAVSLTASGSGDTTVTAANVDGAGTLTVNGADMSGVLSVNATNSSGDATLTGGSGNDTLEGGSGDDTINGGAGNDIIITNGGFDTVDGGAGNDSIRFEGNMSLSDSVDGGDGTDTVTASIAVATRQQIGTVNNVEIGTFDFSAAGTLVIGSASYATINITATGATNVDVDDLPTAINLDLEDDDIDAVALDYVAGAVANIDLGAAGGVAIDTLAVTDAATVNLTSVGGADNTIAGATTLDAQDVETLTITAGVADSGLDIDADFNANDAEVVTVTTSATDAHIDATGVDFLPTADALTSLTVTAGGDDDSDITLDDIGVTAAAAALETLSVTAAEGADVTITELDAEGATMTSATFTSSTANSVVTVSALGSDGANITSINTITVSTVATGTVDLESVEVTTIGSVIVSGAGTFRMDGTDNDITTLERIDATSATGTVTIDMTATTDAVDARFGRGTNTYTASQAADTVELALGFGTDDVVLNGVSAGSISVENFQVGTDDIQIDISGVEALLAGADEVVSIVDMTDEIAAADAIVFHTATSVAATRDLDNAAAGSNILVLDTDFDDGADMLTEIGTGGGFALTLGDNILADDGFLVLWDDGTDSYLSLVENTAGDLDGDTMAAGDLTVTNLVTFTGIADVTDITAADFAAVI